MIWLCKEQHNLLQIRKEKDEKKFRALQVSSRGQTDDHKISKVGITPNQKRRQKQRPVVKDKKKRGTHTRKNPITVLNYIVMIGIISIIGSILHSSGSNL